MGGDRSSGFLYSVSGEKYVAEAVRSARSSLRHNALPHLIFASPIPSEPRPEEGLRFEAFEPSDHPYIDKIANMRRSPFERTLFLDSDTFVVDEVGHVLEVLDHFDIAVAHAPGYRGLPDPEVPKAFYEFNTGVVAWRSNERTAAFLADWQETYSSWLDAEPFPGALAVGVDQPAFRHCAWKHGLRTMVLGPEYNFRITKPGTLVDSVRILHGRHPNPDALAARLNRRQGPRNFSGSLRVLAAKLRQRQLFRPGADRHGNVLQVGRSMLRVVRRR
jgi:hypothetical protein